MAAVSRQQPRLACEECRRRKARCDRVRPQCGACSKSGIVCVMVDKQHQRGPKKGQIEALRNHVATLERQLLNQQGVTERELGCTSNAADMAENFSQEQTSGMISDYEVEHRDHGSNQSASLLMGSFTWDNDTLDMANITPPRSTCPDSTGYPSSPRFSERLQSSSLQALSKQHTPIATPSIWGTWHFRSDESRPLYFDRVHVVAPILHMRRYFSWASQEHTTPARECLRSAMRTMAAAVSAGFHSFCDGLYAETRSMLDMMDALEPATTQLEQIQAGLLLAHYEFMRMHERQAMVTAGRAFRLVQMSRLYDIDGSTTEDTFSEVEERRRTFLAGLCF
ncbi:hypothetical protein AJ79_03384 [Helicocarpus griseus UAMH5409]|uniref:Zn(2)-C6 fungal-type domain-containing protein n=1 Tax=Helicocarpus griseus UAMH5409 TaxID=1447875 RepID=A0A2B7XX79_9EURO|nr:hypothetical protein AJ79_03384 [Helicocarpus griseus UAMH5409]